MSVTSTDLPEATDADRARPALLTRLVLGITGWSLLFSAFGLWAVPGSANVPELSLMKLGVSIFMLIGGMCCIVRTRPGR